MVNYIDNDIIDIEGNVQIKLYFYMQSSWYLQDTWKCGNDTTELKTRNHTSQKVTFSYRYFGFCYKRLVATCLQASAWVCSMWIRAYGWV